MKGECVRISLAGTPAKCSPGGGVLYSVLPNGRVLITFPLDDGRVASFVGEKDSQPRPETYYLYLSRIRIASKGSDFTANIAGLCIVSMSHNGKIWSEIGCTATDENNAAYEFKFTSDGTPVDVQHPGVKTATATGGAHVDTKVIAQATVRLKAKLQQSGIQGIVQDVGKCFDDSRGNVPAIRSCMLYDIATMNLDKSMRKIFESRGMNPGPQSPFLSDKAFNARMQIYSGMAFGGSDSAAYQFFGSAPTMVINGLSK
jgi:hypothetical protein